MGRLCRIVLSVLAAVYVISVLLLLSGMFGLFGATPGPIAGVFLVPLAMPWIYLVDVLPEPLWPWAVVLAPGINLALIWLICRRARRTRKGA